MKEPLERPPQDEEVSDFPDSTSSAVFTPSFSILGFLGQALLVILFATCVRHPEATADTDQYNLANGFFKDTQVFVFVGLGVLGSYLRHYGCGSVAMDLLVAAVVLQWATLVDGFMDCLFGGTWGRVDLSLEQLIVSEQSAFAVLITLGAVLGKVGPLQILCIGTVETVFLSFNKHVCEYRLGVPDPAGALHVHMFGALFGSTLSWVLGTRRFSDDRGGSLRARNMKPIQWFSTLQTIDEDRKEVLQLRREGRSEDASLLQSKLVHFYEHGRPDKASDTMALLGTLVLFVTFPSFNAALVHGNAKARVIMNTVIACTASCTSAFVACKAFTGMKDGKFSTKILRSAVLAGGVAVSSSSAMVMGPTGSTAIGTFAGVLSVYGYVAVDSFLVRTCGLHDTCGVLHMHGIPGLLSAISSVITAATAGDTLYGDSISVYFANRACPGDCHTAGSQAGLHLGALLVTMMFALCGGAMTAAVVCLDIFNPPHQVFEDAEFFAELGGHDLADYNLSSKQSSEKFYSKMEEIVRERERVMNAKAEAAKGKKVEASKKAPDPWQGLSARQRKKERDDGPELESS